MGLWGPYPPSPRMAERASLEFHKHGSSRPRSTLCLYKLEVVLLFLRLFSERACLYKLEVTPEVVALGKQGNAKAAFCRRKVKTICLTYSPLRIILLIMYAMNIYTSCVGLTLEGAITLGSPGGSNLAKEGSISTIVGITGGCSRRGAQWMGVVLYSKIIYNIM